MSAGRILAVDLGERRTGLAISDPLGIIASALGVIECAPDTRVERILRIADEHEVRAIVVGLPRALDGTDTDMTRAVHLFVEQLRSRTSVPVETLDERFTSTRATQSMREMGLSRSKRREKGRVDELAAVLLLQDYLRMRG